MGGSSVSRRVRLAAGAILVSAVLACAPTTGSGPAAARSEVVAEDDTPAPASPPAQVPPPVAVELDLDAFDLPRDVEREWLRKDLQAIGRFAPLFPLRSLDDTLAALGETEDGCHPIDQGFGIEARTCLLPGGYTTCSLLLVSHERVVFEARATCRASDKSWAAIEPVITKAYGLALVPAGFSVDGNVATLSIRDDAAREKAVAALAAALGPRRSTAVPADLAEPLALLTSPSTSLEIGTACGVGGSPPEGNRAMQQLVAADRDDLLRDVMQGMNASGRIYGYIGLRLLGRNDAADDAAFDRLRALDLDLPTCNGCKGMPQKAKTIDLSHFRRRP